jgi:hypothetical protein
MASRQTGFGRVWLPPGLKYLINSVEDCSKPGLIMIVYESRTIYQESS